MMNRTNRQQCCLSYDLQFAYPASRDNFMVRAARNGGTVEIAEP